MSRVLKFQADVPDGFRRCTKCRYVKPVGDFYTKKQRTNVGLSAYCRNCFIVDVTSRNHRKTPEQLAREHELAMQPHRRAARLENDRRYNSRHPERHGARLLVAKALRGKALEKPIACSYCRENRPLEGHHSSYAAEAQLDVVWICHECHTIADMERKNHERVLANVNNQHRQVA